MPTPEWLAEQFEQHRAHLRAVAYRMLGSASEAEDAVQESWIRLGRTDVSGVENLRAWLTTVVARVCLDMLRTRSSRREDPLDTPVPDLVITRADEDPESVLRADGGAVKGMSRIVRGAQAVVAQAATFSKIALSNQVVLVNGNIGVVTRLPDGRLFSVIGFTIARGKVVEMDILADPDRLSRLVLSAIEP